MTMSDPEKIAADIATMKSDLGWIKETMARREVADARCAERLSRVESDVAEARGSWKTLVGLTTGGGLIGALVSRFIH